MVISTEVHDGFEGIGQIALFFIWIAVIAVLLPIGTILRKLFCDANRGSVPRGYLVLISMGLCCLSVVLFFLFITRPLVGDFQHIAVWVCCGSLVAISAFVVSLLARGPGRILAIVQGIYSLAVCIPHFFLVF